MVSHFATGNSGNLLREVVLKTGPGCRQEGAYCQLLGDDVTPKVHYLVEDGYVMDRHRPAVRDDKSLLIKIEALLSTYVWNRRALPSSSERDWKEAIKEFGVEVPAWLLEGPQNLCMVHGDPTSSNVLTNTTDWWVNSQILICDPRPPRDYIPQLIETDMGRIVQSLMGWEVAAYGQSVVKFHAPTFWMNEVTRKRAIFWCGAAAARIQHQEEKGQNRGNILNWCRVTRRNCNV